NDDRRGPAASPSRSNDDRRGSAASPSRPNDDRRDSRNAPLNRSNVSRYPSERSAPSRVDERRVYRTAFSNETLRF
ncbi:MAG: hypothetical protein IKU86_11885, partial [Thermoguttaceae bacterium]|nr:hypothetical protein [Thermoguttaceae bacterium]